MPELFTPEEVEFLESFDYPREGLPEPDQDTAVAVWRIAQRLTREHGVLAYVFFRLYEQSATNCHVCGKRDDPSCVEEC